MTGAFREWFLLPADSILIAGDYNYLLVALSLGIAVFSSTLTMQLTAAA